MRSRRTTTLLTPATVAWQLWWLSLPLALTWTYFAVLIGAIAGALYVVCAKLLLYFHIDDPVDAAPIHFFCGLWGAFAVGVFASKDLIEKANGVPTEHWGFVLGGGGHQLLVSVHRNRFHRILELHDQSPSLHWTPSGWSPESLWRRGDWSQEEGRRLGQSSGHGGWPTSRISVPLLNKISCIFRAYRSWLVVRCNLFVDLFNKIPPISISMSSILSCY